ncbi:21864_t:CDS:2, partial [Gigaspora rosea]
KHWTVLSKNSTKNQDNNQAEDQTKDQAEDQDEDQAEDQVDHNKPHPRVKCKYCPKIFEHGIATQMEAHLNNTCLGAPENAKSNSKQKNTQSNISIPHISTNHLDNEEQESLEYMLAQALFATGLADELVDKVYEDVKKESDKQILEAQSLCMISDGWSNINQESAVYSGEESHTAEWIANQIIRQMEAINIEKFSAVITNTANVMKAAWHIIEEKYPKIVCFGCASYTLNLLIKDILKIHDVKSVIDNATKLVKYFKSHPQALAKLRRIQLNNYNKEIALVLPAITRWGTHLECLQSL